MTHVLTIDDALATRLPLDCELDVLSATISQLGGYRSGRLLPHRLRGRVLRAAVRPRRQGLAPLGDREHRWRGLGARPWRSGGRRHRRCRGWGTAAPRGSAEGRPDRELVRPGEAWADSGLPPHEAHAAPRAPSQTAAIRRPAALRRTDRAGRAYGRPAADRSLHLRVADGQRVVALRARPGVPRFRSPGSPRSSGAVPSRRSKTLRKLATAFDVRLRHLVDPD